MKQTVKQTRREAKKAWNALNDTNCSYKSSIKPRFNATKRKIEWYFNYKENNNVDGLSKNTIKKLSEWADKLNKRQL